MTVQRGPPTLALHTLPPSSGPMMVSQTSCPDKAALSRICNSLKLQLKLMWRPLWWFVWCKTVSQLAARLYMTLTVEMRFCLQDKF